MIFSTINPDAGFFFNSILESLVDGILITTNTDQVLYANTTAQQLYRQSQAQNSIGIPTEILKLHRYILEDSDPSLVLESELTIAHQTYRIRVQRIDLSTSDENCLLTRIENQAESWHHLAHLEAQQYGLTTRESEVWELKRQQCSRQEIAQSLHVSIDTVKKHLGNIQMKRQNYRDGADLV